MMATDNPLRRQRHYTLHYLLRNTRIAGDVCELGCWRGLSAFQIATNLRSFKRESVFHIFDSLRDFLNIRPWIYPGLKEDVAARRKQFACSLEEVRENLKEFFFIQYHKGWIPQRFDEVKDRKFSFVHVDVDLYQPIRDSFHFFYPRMLKGGS